MPAIMQKIVAGTAPDKFTIAHLKGLGFQSSTDRPIIPLLKDLGFLSDDGTPTSRYHEYRDPSKSREIMAEALRDAYSDLFLINERLGQSDKAAVQGKFKTTHNVTDRVAECMTMTFYAFLALADVSGMKLTPVAEPESKKPPVEDVNTQINSSATHTQYPTAKSPLGGLHYSIQIHLPATKDVEVFNAIFKSLKEHLLD